MTPLRIEIVPYRGNVPISYSPSVSPKTILPPIKTTAESEELVSPDQMKPSPSLPAGARRRRNGRLPSSSHLTSSSSSPASASLPPYTRQPSYLPYYSQAPGNHQPPGHGDRSQPASTVSRPLEDIRNEHAYLLSALAAHDARARRLLRRLADVEAGLLPPEEHHPRHHHSGPTASSAAAGGSSAGSAEEEEEGKRNEEARRRRAARKQAGRLRGEIAEAGRQEGRALARVGELAAEVRRRARWAEVLVAQQQQQQQQQEQQQQLLLLQQWACQPRAWPQGAGGGPIPSSAPTLAPVGGSLSSPSPLALSPMSPVFVPRAQRKLLCSLRDGAQGYDRVEPRVGPTGNQYEETGQDSRASSEDGGECEEVPSPLWRYEVGDGTCDEEEGAMPDGHTRKASLTAPLSSLPKDERRTSLPALRSIWQ